MKDIVRVTEQAENVFFDLMKNDPAAVGKKVRLALAQPNAKKFQYMFVFDDMDEEDVVVARVDETIQIIANRSLVDFLDGLTVSWRKRGIYGSGFEIKKD